jgi:hypothetical protein
MNTVGDSHKGPLNNQGETRLKPAKTRITDQLTNLKHAHNTITVLVALVAQQGGTAECPSSKVCLARGLHAPSDRVLLAQGLNTPSGEVRLTRGLNTPSTRTATLEGSTPPRRGPPRSRAHARTTSTLLPPCTGI